jgi:hypothetical protein
MRNKKIQISFKKNKSKKNEIFSKIDKESLELFREIMGGRFNNK